MNLWTLEFDGSCWPNPGGKACYGFILYCNGKPELDGHGTIGDGADMSNNVAEFYALYRGLEQFEKYHTALAYNSKIPAGTQLVVKGDSQLVINMMSRRWKAKAGLYLPYYQQAADFATHLRKSGVNITFEWIPREANQACDDLSKLDNPTAKK